MLGGMHGLSRRQFVHAVGRSAALAPVVSVVGGWAQVRTSAPQAPGSVMTVRGPVTADELGVVLVHEHVLVDFIGADQVSPSRYDRDEAFRRALPFLREARERGVRTLVECTPAYLGRDPQLLLRLSQAADLHIVTNTGYYGAAGDRYVPAHAFRASAREIADRWIAESRDGLDGTDVRPGFMKIGVDAGPLSPVDAKLVEAAALTCKATGLPIASHTGDGVAAHEQMDLLDSLGVPLEAFIWVHAQNEQDTSRVIDGARRGAWISLDGVSSASAERYAVRVAALADAGMLDRVLLSHDAGWYRVGEPGGGDYTPHTSLFDDLLPALRGRLGEAAITRLLEHNPARALGLRATGATAP
jgi:phosphotriesterase-related protein